MPSPSKKPRAAAALGRFISSLRPDRRSGATGSLPVQTGFPTSLADLYVKNQSRLKKPCKKTKKKRHGNNSECALTVGSASDATDSATSLVLSSSGNADEVIAEEVRIPSVSNDVLVCPRRNSLRFGFVAILNILVLALLAILGKKLIVGFTALAFFLWFLDSVRLDLVQFFNPRAEVRTNLCLEQRSFALVSPIREVEIQTESDSTEVEIRAELNQSSESDVIWEENPDFCEVQASNLKKKSILKRLLPKKRSQRKPQQKDEALDDTIRSREMETASISEKEEDDVVNLVMEEENQEEQSTREVPPAQIMEGEILQSREITGVSWFVVFLMVILFGLMEGKAVALVLTIFCFISLSLIELARRKQSKERIRLTL
jgi:hypothetical protein